MKELSEAASMVEAQRQENDGYTVIKNNSLVELEDVQSFSENEVADEECHKPPFRSDHIRRSRFFDNDKYERIKIKIEQY